MTSTMLIQSSRLVVLACALGGGLMIALAGCGNNSGAAAGATPTTSRPDLLVDRPCIQPASINHTPAVRAVFDDDPVRLVALLDAGTDVNEQDANWETLLHHAARNGRIEIMKILIERGAELNARARCNATPLLWAARSNQLEACRLLVESGAEINARGGIDNQFTPMGFAARANYMDVVDYLRENGGEL